MRDGKNIELGAFVADVEDRRAARPERCEQVNNARHRIRIVAPLARGLPFVERALDVDDDEGGEGMGHGVRIPEFASPRGVPDRRNVNLPLVSGRPELRNDEMKGRRARMMPLFERILDRRR